MWFFFRRLEYPRVQSYAIPYITEAFYAISAILIILLAALNVAIVGNDIVTELKNDPNNVDSQWWAPRWMPEGLKLPTVPGPCQPLTLPQHATAIRTNSTLPIFSYTLLNGLGTYQNGTPKWFDSVRYNAEPLENCTVQNITALINFQDRGHKLTSQIICSVKTEDPEVPPTMKFSTTFSRMANTDLGSDDIVDYISSYVVPRTADISKATSVLLVNGSSALNMLGVLDAFGSEILKALWARKWTWKIAGNESWPDQAVVKWSSQPNCTGLSNSRGCRPGGLEHGGIDQWYSNTRGSQDWNPLYLLPLNTTLFNYFVAFRDALHLDLGTVDPEKNIFLNNDAFQMRIMRDPYMSTAAPLIIGQPRPDNRPAYTPDQFWSTCTWGWGCVNGTWTEALLRQDPTQNISSGLPLQTFGGPSYATVIDVKYVCPVFKVKRIGPLLVSVFIGTFSMYTVLYGIFSYVAPRIDEYFRRKRGLRRFSLDLDEVRQYPGVAYHYQDIPRSADPYHTIFETPDFQQYSTDTVPRYDPVSRPPFPEPWKQNSPLPVGAYLPGSKPNQPPQLLPPIQNLSSLTLSQTRDESEAQRSIAGSPNLNYSNVGVSSHYPNASSSSPDPDQERNVLLPGVFEHGGYLSPSTSTGYTGLPLSEPQILSPMSAVLADAPTSHVPSVEGHGEMRGKSFSATVVGGPRSGES